MESAQTAAKASGEGAARHLKPGYCLQNAARCFLKPLEKLLESAQNAAKASGEDAARQLKPGYWPQNAATACGKGAARDLEAGYCLTLLSEATRKALGKRPDCRKSLGRRRCEAFEAMLRPPECQFKPGYCPQNAAKAFGKAPRMQQQPVARAPRGIWRQATA